MFVQNTLRLTIIQNDGYISYMNSVRQTFWNELNEKINDRTNTPLKETTQVDNETDSWRPQRHLADSVSYVFNLPFLQKDQIQVYLIPRSHRDVEAVLEHLSKYREEFIQELDGDPEWRPEDGKDKIIIRREGIDVENRRDNWDEYQEWLIQTAEDLYFTIGPKLAGFDDS